MLSVLIASGWQRVRSFASFQSCTDPMLLAELEGDRAGPTITDS